MPFAKDILDRLIFFRRQDNLFQKIEIVQNSLKPLRHRSFFQNSDQGIRIRETHALGKA